MMGYHETKNAAKDMLTHILRQSWELLGIRVDKGLPAELVRNTSYPFDIIFEPVKNPKYIVY